MKKSASLLIITLLSLSGCGTMNSSAKKDNALEETLKQKSKAMNLTVHGVVEADVDASRCLPMTAKLKVAWNWKDAVVAANACVKSRDFSSVEYLANQLAIRNTTTPWGPYYMAVLAFERKQLDRAQWMTELALKRAPEYAVISYLKGQILWEKKEYKDAVENFEKSLSYDDTNGPAHLLLGQVYLQDQIFDRAATHFAGALKTLPDNLVALNGQAQSQLRLNNPQVALEAYIRLSQIDPTDGQYLTHVGDIYEASLNDHVHALNAYHKLRDQMKGGRVKKNGDPEIDAKIKDLEATVKKERSVASTQSKDEKAKGGSK